MNQFEVHLTPDEFDLPLTVGSGQTFRWKEVEAHVWQGCDGKFSYRVRLMPASMMVEPAAAASSFGSLFRLEVPLDSVEQRIISAGPELEACIRGLRGLRLLRPSDPVETFFAFLCTPNNHMARITTMVAYLASLGTPTDWGFIFPEPERIAEATEAELRDQGFGYRARTIPAVARELVRRGGRGYLESLKAVSYRDAVEALLTFDGIGPKLADCIALLALHKTEAVPVDTHLWQAATRVYFPQWRGSSLTEGRYRAVGDLFRDRFGEWAGWAHQYLFYDNLLRSRRKATSRLKS